MKMTLYKNKLAFWMGVCGILITVLLILVTLQQRNLVVNGRKESLQILANEKVAQVNNFLESKIEQQNIIASMNVFKQAVLHPNDPAIIATAKDRINELKDTVPRIALFTNEGIMFLAESGPVPIDYSTIPYFVSKNNKLIFMRYYDEFQKKDYYSVLGPIYDRVEKDKVIGAIAFDVDLDKISALMKESLENETNEVYLIDETGLLLSGSEYIGQGNKNGVLIQEIDSDGAKECLEHVKKYDKGESVEKHTEEVIQYTNYMGNIVLGARAYAPEIMGCVIAEESLDEIYHSSILTYIKNIFNK